MNKHFALGGKMAVIFLMVLAVGTFVSYLVGEISYRSQLKYAFNENLTAGAPIQRDFNAIRTTNQFIIHSKKNAENDYEVRFKYCQDIKCTSATDTLIDTSHIVVFGTSVIKHTNDLPFLAFGAKSNSGAPYDPQLKVARCFDVNCFNKEISVIGTDLNPTQISMTLGSDGNPIIAFSDAQAVNTDLTVVHCLEPFCETYEINNILSLDTTNGYYSLYLRTKIAIAGNGLPVMSFRNPVDESIGYAYCHNISCSSSENFLFDTNHGAVRGFYHDLVINEGKPVIVYTSTSGYGGSNWPNEIRVATCKDYTCTEMNISKFGRFINSPSSVSINIGSDGYPIIGYGSGSGSGTKLFAAKCTDPLCISDIIETQIYNGSISTEPSAGSVLSIGSLDKKPLFLATEFQSVSDGRVWLLTIHCSDNVCAGPVTETNHGIVSYDFNGLFAENSLDMAP